MKNYSTANLRNVVLLGGTRSGKTTLTEAILFEGKIIDRRGTVEAKTTASDSTEVEQLYQRSIYSTPIYAEVKDCKPLSTRVALFSLSEMLGTGFT